MLRKRRTQPPRSGKNGAASLPEDLTNAQLPSPRDAVPSTPMADGQSDEMMEQERRPLLDEEASPAEAVDTTEQKKASWANYHQWIVLALASGACAAFNGVFAKLTTTELTSSFSNALAHFLHVPHLRDGIEVILRAIFFGLNLVFNGVMWTLFTAALARGHSTTQVSIINTSANFVITALLGLAIFAESLPPLWWLGAAMLIAGNVIVGRKDESGQSTSESGDQEQPGDEGDGVGEDVVRAVVPGYGAVAQAEERVVSLDGGAEEADKEDEEEDDSDVVVLGEEDGRPEARR